MQSGQKKSHPVISRGPLPGFQWQIKVFSESPTKNVYNNPGGDWHPVRGSLTK